MDKRDFLKTSGALLAGSMLSRLTAEEQHNAHRKNWAGNFEYSTDRLALPETTAKLQELVKSSKKLRALGARHSFNRIADSKDLQVSLEHFDQMTIDPKTHTVIVGAGVRYGQLAPYLHSHGYALHNLASLPHVSVVGACATATHGSGSKNGNLSTAVSAMELVTANGDLVTLTREKNGDQFNGAVVSLGAVGIVSKITLDLHPTFNMRQVLYENLSFSQLEHHLDEIFSAGYSVSLFTDWQNHRATQVWIKSRADQGGAFQIKPEFFGAKAATKKLHPIGDHSAESCTEQMGIVGPWFERMPHFRMNFTPSSGDELQTEYFVPRDKAYQAILAVEKLRDQITPHLFVTEFRTIDADNFWMSPCRDQPSLTIHFTWKPEWPAVKALLPKIEAQLAPFNARPHWAKLFTLHPSRLQSLYAKLPTYKELLMHYDPQGKFRNEFLTTNLYS